MKSERLFIRVSKKEKAAIKKAAKGYESIAAFVLETLLSDSSRKEPHVRPHQ